MIKHSVNLNIQAPTKDIALTKAKLLSQLSSLSTETLEILAEKSKVSGIEKKLKRWQNAF